MRTKNFEDYKLEDYPEVKRVKLPSEYLLQIKIDKWSKLAVILSALLLVNAMTGFITSDNQQNGLYPVDADSIGIPLMFTIGVSILLWPIFFTISLLPNKGLLSWLKSKGFVHRLAVRIGLVLLYGPAFLFAVIGTAYWGIPDHYSIAASYLALFVVLLIVLFFSWHEIGQNQAGS